MDSEDTHVRISRPELEAESKSLGANAHQTKSQWDRQFILGHRLKTNRSIFKVKMDGWINECQRSLNAGQAESIKSVDRK